MKSTLYFDIKCEDPTHPNLFAYREGENSEFVINSKDGSYEKYNKEYLGTVTTNFWGTGFDIWDYGIRLSDKEKLFVEEYIVDGFMKLAKNYGRIVYDTNFLAEVPRSFKFHF